MFGSVVIMELRERVARMALGYDKYVLVKNHETFVTEVKDLLDWLSHFQNGTLEYPRMKAVRKALAEVDSSKPL